MLLNINRCEPFPEVHFFLASSPLFLPAFEIER